MRRGGTENVACVERRRHRLEHDLRRGDFHRSLDPSERLAGRDEQPVVGAHEQPAALCLDRHVTVSPDARVDNGHEHRIARDVRQRVNEQHGSGYDVEWRHAVREVHDPAFRSDSRHHRMADTHPLVAKAEIAAEDDRADGRLIHSASIHPGARQCKAAVRRSESRR